MPEIRAFRAFRYDLGRVGALADVVAPPPEEVGPAPRDALRRRSPFNVAHLLWPEDGLAGAARRWRSWRDEGVLRQDSARSLYVCHQEFETAGRRLTRRGFLARVALETTGAAGVLPLGEAAEEEIEERLQALRTVGVDLAPSLGLYADADCLAQAALDAAVGRAPPLEAAGPDGVCRLWPVADQHAVSAAAGLLAGRPVILVGDAARCEAARRAVGFALMLLVSLSDPGLALPAPLTPALLEGLAAGGRLPPAARVHPPPLCGLVFSPLKGS
jgi:uncharacterized protein (DUF1015 family)